MCNVILIIKQVKSLQRRHFRRQSFHMKLWGASKNVSCVSSSPPCNKININCWLKLLSASVFFTDSQHWLSGTLQAKMLMNKADADRNKLNSFLWPFPPSLYNFLPLVLKGGGREVKYFLSVFLPWENFHLEQKRGEGLFEPQPCSFVRGEERPRQPQG